MIRFCWKVRSGISPITDCRTVNGLYRSSCPLSLRQLPRQGSRDSGVNLFTHKIGKRPNTLYVNCKFDVKIVGKPCIHLCIAHLYIGVICFDNCSSIQLLPISGNGISVHRGIKGICDSRSRIFLLYPFYFGFYHLAVVALPLWGPREFVLCGYTVKSSTMFHQKWRNFKAIVVKALAEPIT